ncbi:MAG: peptidoglycan bridge formation glycyltransferase FemA/FemB family protein [Bacilli bacterium]|nr:peptidoglycan bridge formation glycyltransferase FemA/FemB family protein [Bacilli bacterium]
MDFKEITEEEYTNFWENHPNKTFLSSPKISKLREINGWNTYFVGLIENETLVAATVLYSHKRHFGVYEFYAPRGFLLDYNNLELLEEFTKQVKKFVNKKKGYVLRIDPYVINKQRDLDGNIVEGGEDNTKVVECLERLGYKKVPKELKEQVGWMFSLDIKDKTEEEILKEMKPGTRNTIRKAEKIGIDVREISYEELDEFQKIMEETSKRKGFSNRKITYYQEMYKIFHDSGEVKYFITSLDLNKYIEKQQEEIKEKEDKIKNLSDAKYNEGQKKNLQSEIDALNKRIEEANNIKKEKNTDKINLSGSMFMLIKPEVIYLSSGNYEEYLKYNSQYLIQWELIKYGIKNGFSKHNFYGIPEDINTHPKDYGIYEFKRGFNGYVEELIGEFELPIKPHYSLFKIIHKIKK